MAVLVPSKPGPPLLHEYFSPIPSIVKITLGHDDQSVRDFMHTRFFFLVALFWASVRTTHAEVMLELETLRLKKRLVFNPTTRMPWHSLPC